MLLRMSELSLLVMAFLHSVCVWRERERERGSMNECVWLATGYFYATYSAGSVSESDLLVHKSHGLQPNSHLNVSYPAGSMKYELMCLQTFTGTIINESCITDIIITIHREKYEYFQQDN